MTNPTNTDLAAALREIADTLPLGSALIVLLAADRLGDGWIEWDGSQFDYESWPKDDSWAPPEVKGKYLEIKYRNGIIEQHVAGDCSGDAHGAYWKNEGQSYDIVAYRIVK